MVYIGGSYEKSNRSTAKGYDALRKDVCEVPDAGVARKVVRFAAFLRSRGFRIFQSGVQDSLRSLGAIDLLCREDALSALRANLATNDLEWEQFPALFAEFWSQALEHATDSAKEEAEEPPGDETGEGESRAENPKILQTDQAREGAEPTGHRGIAYSPVSLVHRKDLGRLEAADMRVAQLALRRLMAPFLLDISRRRKRARGSGALDFARVMKRSLRVEGFPLELFFKQRKKRLRRLVILADVSGSMDRYARFVMPFILGLRRVGSRAELFVFSTVLTRVTALLRHLSLDRILQLVSAEVPDWSGGTRIGHSLHQFNAKHGRLLGRRTVVVILSDGWDLGGKELLRREMATLSAKTRSVVWLNPLAGEPAYQPLCQGMRIALPFVDFFLPADSMESLQQVGRLLSRLLVH
jgi:uncharacterized protein